MDSFRGSIALSQGMIIKAPVLVAATMLGVRIEVEKVLSGVNVFLKEDRDSKLHFQNHVIPDSEIGDTRLVAATRNTIGLHNSVAFSRVYATFERIPGQENCFKAYIPNSEMKAPRVRSLKPGSKKPKIEKPARQFRAQAKIPERKPTPDLGIEQARTLLATLNLARTKLGLQFFIDEQGDIKGRIEL